MPGFESLSNLLQSFRGAMESSAQAVSGASRTPARSDNRVVELWNGQQLSITVEGETYVLDTSMVEKLEMQFGPGLKILVEDLDEGDSLRLTAEDGHHMWKIVDNGKQSFKILTSTGKDVTHRIMAMVQPVAAKG
jgi:hypothetical protein